MKIFLWSLICSAVAALAGSAAHADEPDKSPSKDKVQWLGTSTSVEGLAQYDYVAGGRTDLGNGQHSDVSESQISIRELVAERYFRAFLFRGGVEWERFGFDAPYNSLLPQHLHALDAYLGVDFRFSRQDLIRVQARPGIYSDFDTVDSNDFNVPVTVAYSRIVSRNFQWAAGVSQNGWRRYRWLGGGGFRWQIDDRWKLKAMLPEPMIEYKARDDLHLSVGADLRGDTYRVSNNFGTERGNAELNGALLDYQEIRVGAGASWNWKPLIEFNLHAGYVVDRSFDYHNGGPILTSRPAPYVMFNIQTLFEVGHDGEDESALDTQSPQIQIPTPDRIVPKIFTK